MSVSVSQLTPVHAAKNSGGKALSIHDIWKIGRVGKPCPAPSNDYLIVPVTRADLDKNTMATRLWKLPTDGSKATPLTSAEHSATAPAISPDGGSLAFVRKTDTKEKAQLYVMPLNGGEAEKLTDMPLGVGDPQWTPDGNRIVFVSAMYKGAKSVEETKTRMEEIEKNPVKAKVTEDRVFRFWDTWLTNDEKPHLFIIDVKSKKSTDLTPKSNRWFEFMDPSGQYDISPDGKEIVFSADISEPPHDRLRWALFTVSTSGGEVRCLTPDNPADDLKPRYSPDGQSILYGKQSDPFFYADRVQLVLRDRTTGEETEIAPAWDRSAASWSFASDGSIVLVAEDRARTKLFSISVGDKEPTELTSVGSVSGVVIGKDDTAYFLHQTLSSPSEVASIPQGGGEMRRLAIFNERFEKEIALGEVKEIEYPGADGKTVQAYVVLPPEFDAAKKWPLVHVIHGGPHGVSGDDFHFRWNGHLFAAPGYVSIMVNFHGSTSWGQEFARCIQGAHGGKPFTDVMNGTDAILASGFIDENKMAATGASYGGYLVSWIAGHTDRFKCIVNHAGVADTHAMYASDVTQGRHQAYGGEPWDNQGIIDDWNPSRFSKGFVTPMLVSHGERDYRVPVTQGLEIYGTLKAKGVDAKLIYFPDENHWVLKPQNSIFWCGEVFDWLKRYLT